MELIEVSCANYKAFPEEVRLEIRPLTVFVGKNNAGKSVLARLPVLIAHALSSRGEEPLDPRVGELEFGTVFRDFIYRRNPHGALSLGARFSEDAGTTELRTTLQGVSHEGRDNAVVASCSLAGSGLNLELEWEPSPDEPPRYRGVGPVEFRGLLPHVHNPSLSEDVRAGLDRWRGHFDTLSDRVSHLGPFRRRPEWFYRKAEHRPAGLGSDGGHAAHWLDREDGLLERVSAWYQEHLDGWRLRLDASFSAFQCVLERRGTTVHLANAGDGMTQVLPVVVQQLYHQVRKTGPCLDIVEHPELHLHPAAHGGLADLFVESVRRQGVRILVETHSETFLLRLRRRVAEGKLDPSDVVVYWVEESPHHAGSSLRIIEILDNGEVSDWPTGVFSESYNEVRAMRRAVRKRSGDGG